MDAKILASVFATVFVAELGDKTQLSTMLFAADRNVSKFTVFAGAAGALVLASAVGVLVGGVLSGYVSAKVLKIAAGMGFIGIGLWTLFKPG